MNNTNMKYQVIKRHQSEFPNPVIISRGEKLVIGEKYEENKAWNDWYFCETEDRNKGWIPKQVIQWLGGAGRLFRQGIGCGGGRSPDRFPGAQRLDMVPEFRFRGRRMGAC